MLDRWYKHIYGFVQIIGRWNPSGL